MRSLSWIVALSLLAACGEPTFSTGSDPLPQVPGAGLGGAGGAGGHATGGSSTSSSQAGGAGGTSSANTTGGAGGSGATGGAGGSGATGGAGGTSSSSTTTGSSTTSTSTGSGGGGSGVGSCGEEVPIGDSVIVQQGSTAGLLLRGTVVTPDQAFAGEVLVEGDTIQCVAASCSAAPGAATATVVDTKGIILPGFIDTHNHILFDVFDETHWSPTKSYGNHNQWGAEARYKAMVNAKQYLNGEAGSPINLNCELNKYGELKGLIAGTTSIAGAGTPPSDKACYGTVARTIDQKPNGLPADKVQMATLFPNKSSADNVCKNFESGKTEAYLIHVAEGVDATARGEFTKLGTITTTEGCLYHPKTTVVHGTALGEPELATMAASGMSLVWSPRSNVFLYGAGTDLSKTTNIKLAREKGINVSIAPDWSLGGSQNILDEVRFADSVDNTQWSDVISKKALLQMVTTNAAKTLGLDGVLGSVEVGKKADLVILDGDPAKPYDALLDATPGKVRLVLVNGAPLYGDAVLGPVAQTSPACEHLAICDRCKFLCVAQSGGGPNDKLGQTYAEIASALGAAIEGYDALALTEWSFAPLTPLVKCH